MNTSRLLRQLNLPRSQPGRFRQFLGFALPLLVIAGCSQPAAPERAANDAGDESTVASVTEVTEEPVVAMKPAIESEKKPSELGDTAAIAEDAQPVLQPLDPPPETLGIGDPNPGLHVAKWVKGDAVEAPLTGKVHVDEFWATWCGPCRVGMPHISELQTHFGDDVVFMGITREDEATVNKFLASEAPSGKTWDEVVQYRLAIDDRDWTNTAYMRAANQNGIPCAFVVGRDGVVEWIGHPGSIDEPLDQIVSGNWDRQAAIAKYEQQKRLQELNSEISKFARSGDWDAALELVDNLEQETGKSQLLTNLRMRLLQTAGRTEEVAKVRAELVDLAWDDAQMLNGIAWTIASAGDAAQEDLELALKAAARASELRNDNDPAILDTLARCHYELGDLDEAIKWQRKAAEENNGQYQQIDAALQRYLNEKKAGADDESK